MSILIFCHFTALQAFFHVPALAQWLIADKEHRERGSCTQSEFQCGSIVPSTKQIFSAYQMCIICAMAQTLLRTQQQHHAITPSLITNRLHNICKHLTLGRQEDAHEFLVRFEFFLSAIFSKFFALFSVEIC